MLLQVQQTANSKSSVQSMLAQQQQQRQWPAGEVWTAPLHVSPVLAACCTNTVLLGRQTLRHARSLNFRYCFFLFEACYVKHVCDTVKMTNWGRVYYTNFLSALALLLVFPFCSSEHEVLRSYAFPVGQVVLLLLSGIVGVCMSHAGAAEHSAQRRLVLKLLGTAARGLLKRPCSHHLCACCAVQQSSSC